MTKRRVKKDTRWKFIKVTFLVCMFIGAFTLIWLRTAVVGLEYELSELGTQKEELSRKSMLVSAEKANFYSVANIEESAMKKLGMGFPERERIIFVRQTTGAVPYKVSAGSLPRDD